MLALGSLNPDLATTIKRTGDSYVLSLPPELLLPRRADRQANRPGRGYGYGPELRTNQRQEAPTVASEGSVRPRGHLSCRLFLPVASGQGYDMPPEMVKKELILVEPFSANLLSKTATNDILASVPANVNINNMPKPRRVAVSSY